MMERDLLFQREHVNLLLKYNPQERYKYLLENSPIRISRISVTHLAQYLGISRETLSRMRAKVYKTEIM